MREGYGVCVCVCVTTLAATYLFYTLKTSAIRGSIDSMERGTVEYWNGGTSD